MDSELYARIDEHLSKENYQMALAELATLDDATSPVAVSLRVQVLRASGLGDQAADIARRNWNTITNDESAVIRCLPVLLNKGFTSTSRAMLDSLRERATDKICKALYELSPLVDSDTRYLKFIRDLAQGCGSDEVISLVDEHLIDEFPIPRLPATDDSIGMLLKLFASQKNVYAVQVMMNGRWGYIPIREPVSPAVIRGHIEGRQTIGVYPLLHDGTCWFAAIDVDVKKSHLGALENDLYRSGIFKAMEEATKSLTNAVTAAGLDVFTEFSGFKGFHIWIFFDEPVEARIIRQILKKIVEPVNLPLSISIEIFPKQDTLKPDQIGNLIKLPCGLHQRNARFSCFVEPETLAPIKNQESYILSIRRCHRNTVLDVADKIHGRITTPLNITDVTGEPSSLECVGPIPTDVIVVGELPNGIKRILNGCEVIRSIVAKARDTRVLSSAERHVLTYVFGVLGDDGRTFVHRVMHRCLDYDAASVNKKLDAVPPNPMSCPKLRKWLPEAARVLGCRCRFDLPSDGYPSPLVHAGLFPRCSQKVRKKRTTGKRTPLLESASAARQSHTISEISDNLDDLMSRFFTLLKEIRERHIEIDLLKKRLSEHFNNEDGTTQGPSGRTYRRRTTENGIVRYEKTGKKRKRKKRKNFN